MITAPNGQEQSGMDFTFDREGGRSKTGLSGKMYYDTQGIPTVGPGFNLNGGYALPLIENKGYDIGSLKRGESAMSQQDMKDIFNQSYARATRDAQDVYDTHVGAPNSFAKLPEDARDSLIDMTYNMGKTGFSKFNQTFDLIKDKRYADAGQHIYDSIDPTHQRANWATQTGDRSKAIANTLIMLGNQN